MQQHEAILPEAEAGRLRKKLYEQKINTSVEKVEGKNCH